MAFHAVSLDDYRNRPVTALDVIRLRDALTFEDGVTLSEAQALFDIELSPVKKHVSWKGVFIDAIAEHAIDNTEPYGYLTALKVDWLLRQAAPRGRILSRNCFELLVALTGLARWVPERLVSALLDEVYCAVAAGDGPLRQDGRLAPGTITERDSEVVRHILYMASTGSQGGITRGEAEGLLAIDSIVACSAPVAGWTELLAKTIGDAVLASTGKVGPIREVFLAPDCTGTDKPSLLAALHRGFARYGFQTNEDRAIASLERQRVSIITGDDIRLATATWLEHALAGQHERPSVALALMMESLGNQGRSLSDQSRSIDVAVLPLSQPRRAIKAA